MPLSPAEIVAATQAFLPEQKGIPWIRFNPPAASSATLDDQDLIASAGLALVLRFAEKAGPSSLAEKHSPAPSDKGANLGVKVTSLVGAVLVGADCVDGTNLLCHGGQKTSIQFRVRTLNTGFFLRAFTFGT